MATPGVLLYCFFSPVSSFTLTPVEMFSVWQRTWPAQAERELLAPRGYTSVTGKDDWTHQLGGWLRLDHISTLAARTWAVSQGEGHRQASWKDTNEQSSIQMVIR